MHIKIYTYEGVWDRFSNALVPVSKSIMSPTCVYVPPRTSFGKVAFCLFIFVCLFYALLCSSRLCSSLSSLSPPTNSCSNMLTHSMPSAA